MKIGIDARLYGTIHGGIGRYVKELILNLLKIDKENQYIFFVYTPKDKQKIVNDINSLKIKHIQRDLSNRIKFLLAPFRWYSIKEQVFLPKILKKTNTDVIHFPHFNVPIKYKGNFITTIHDLIIHKFPNERASTLPKWLYKLKLKGYKKVMECAVHNSKIIITPSQSTKKDILENYNVEENKIKVIYQGVSELEKIDTKYKIKIPYNRYILYAGSFYPHKNLERLIKAFLAIRKHYGLNISLVLSGKKDYFYKQLLSFIKNNVYKKYINDIIFTGYANDKELAALYKNADLFVFPSLYEGFGIPPLEAMKFDVPVTAGNISSIPEICKNAAFYFNPRDINDIAVKIYTALTDTYLRKKLIKNGKIRINKFSWENTAYKTLETYEKLKSRYLAF